MRWCGLMLSLYIVWCGSYLGECFAGENDEAAILLSDATVQGDTLRYVVRVSSAAKTTAVLAKLEYAAEVVQFTSWEGGEFIDNAWTYGPDVDEEDATVSVAVATMNKFPTTRTSGEIGTAKFLRVAEGDPMVSLIRAGLADELYQEDWPIRSEGQIQRARPIEVNMPVKFALQGVRPNPVINGATIRFEIPRPGAEVAIRIYDVTGREVRTLVDESKPAGYHVAAWDLTNNAQQKVAPGLYFCRMEAGSFRDVRKLILLK